MCSAFITSHVLHHGCFILRGSMWLEPLHPKRPDSGVFCASDSPRCLFSSCVNPRCIPGSPLSLHVAFVSTLWNFLGLHFACIIECLPQLNGSLCSVTQQGLSCSYKFKFNINVGGEWLWQHDASPQFYEHHCVVTVRYDIHFWFRKQCCLFCSLQGFLYL